MLAALVVLEVSAVWNGFLILYFPNTRKTSLHTKCAYNPDEPLKHQIKPGSPPAARFFKENGKLQNEQKTNTQSLMGASPEMPSENKAL